MGLSVVVHDVAPARWDRCTALLRALREVERAAGVALPLTLLVVPRWHGDAAAPVPYLRWLHRLQRQGHEIALHGYTHLDDAAALARGADALRRRVLTAGEGEFAALDEAAAAERLDAGLRWARAHDLAPRGFVPPAWLIGEPGLAAVAAAGFAWTATRTRLVAFGRDGAAQAVAAPSLVFSTRAAWRRGASLALAAVQAARWRVAPPPLLRFELHPDDAAHAAIRRRWQALLRRELASRRPLRAGEAGAPDR